MVRGEEIKDHTIAESPILKIGMPPEIDEAAAAFWSAVGALHQLTQG